MAGRWRHRRRYAPLSAAALAWETEQSQAMGLDLVPLDPGTECPWCREGNPHPEEDGSGPPVRKLAGRTKRRGGWDAWNRMGGVLLLGIAVVIVLAVLIADRVGVLRGA